MVTIKEKNFGGKLMKNKNELLDKQNKNVTFEEMEKVEEFGAAQDYITGASIGIGIVAAIVALT